MPAEVLDAPPGISCVFSDGSRVEMTLGDAVGARLVRDLLTGLAELVHPHGTVDSASSVRNIHVCWIASSSPPRSLAS